MLTPTCDHGRSVIGKVCPPLGAPVATRRPEEPQQYLETQTLFHKGRPRAIQGLDERTPSPGDFVVERERFTAQVVRRMHALVSDLILALPQERHAPRQQYKRS